MTNPAQTMLEPCPFCRRPDAFINSDKQIECAWCGATGPIGGATGSDAKVICWNTRAHPAIGTPDDAREALKKIISEWDRLEAEELQLDEGFEQAITAARKALASIPSEQEVKPVDVREACAVICDKHAEWAESKIQDGDDPASSSSQMWACMSNTANDLADMIRNDLPPMDAPPSDSPGSELEAEACLKAVAAGTIDWKMEVERLNRLLVAAQAVPDNKKDISASVSRELHMDQILTLARELGAVTEKLIASEQAYRQLERKAAKERRRLQAAASPGVIDGAAIAMTLVVPAEGIELYLGNCRDIIPMLAGRFDTVVSDPPYGVNARAGMGGGSKGDGGIWAGTTIEGDSDVSVRDEALHLAGVPFAVIAAVRLPHPTGTKATVVWDKGEHTGAGDLRLPWKPNFDLVHIGGDGWSWHRRGSGIVKFNAVAGCVGNQNDGKRFHPFEKPCSLMAHFVQRAPGKRILDPFMGSGTTGVAAIRCGSGFTGIEINRKFFDIACRRIADELARPDMFVAPPHISVDRGGA